MRPRRVTDDFQMSSASSKTQKSLVQVCATLLFMNGQSELRDPVDLRALRSKLQCQVIGPGDPEYQVARRVWNGMIDRNPSAIVRPASIADVMQVVRLVREYNLPVCVRGG